MITIKRIAWTRVAEYRELKIDERYIEEINRFAKERCLEVLPPITAEDIKNAVQRNDDANLFLDKEYKWGFPWNPDGHTWTCTLAEWLRDIINDDLWDVDYDTEYLETEDWEDSVIESEDE